MTSHELTVTDVVVLVGSPHERSRTSSVATVVGAGLASTVGTSSVVVELAELGPTGLDPDDARLKRAQELVGGARLLVVATPVYKAAYTGLLKLFLDGLEPNALEETVAVPVVVSASSAHGATADMQLRHVLQASGALLPVPSFVLEEHHLDHLPLYVDAWQRRIAPAVGAVVGALSAQEAAVL